MNDLPLSGVRVLDLSLLLPGPLCSMYLGDLGAEVIKVENPRAMDGTRVMFRSSEGVPGLYLMLNRNKKAMTLNLKKKESSEILYKLLETTDILLEGFRPDAMEKMGFGYEDLKQKFPRLIYCGISGYGSEGIWKDFAGHDANYLALSGILDQIGPIEAPVLPGFQLADIGGGSLTALSGILAALYHREKTGKGMKIDVSMMESSLQFLSLYAGIYLSTGKIPERGNELLSGALPNYNIYKISGNRFVLLGTLEERFFQSFLRQTNQIQKLEELPFKEENFPEWKKILTQFFLKETVESLQPVFKNTESCLTLIRNLKEVFEDTEFQKSGLIGKMNHPKYGEISQIGSPFSFLRKKEMRLPPPLHGEHTEEILSNLGYAKEAIQEMMKSRII
ncbi:MAG: CoA transferase [Leptospiraceae bacterium]|nr:CoA transferase [Leptospiraceae bacterium]MCP5510506.1 CoA transferase [Leptospiraceae bacterium]